MVVIAGIGLDSARCAEGLSLGSAQLDRAWFIAVNAEVLHRQVTVYGMSSFKASTKVGRFRRR